MVPLYLFAARFTVSRNFLPAGVMHFPFGKRRRPADRLPGIVPACVTASTISRLPVEGHSSQAV
jgi:hypothetical protein